MKQKLINIIAVLICLAVVCAGIFLPGYILTQQTQSAETEIFKVEKTYYQNDINEQLLRMRSKTEN